MIPVLVCEYLFDRLSSSASDSFCLGPFLFYRIEVRRIRWQIFERMARLPYVFFCVGSFVECRIVHDHNRFRRQLRDQVLFKPKIEDIGIDIGGGQPNA